MKLEDALKALQLEGSVALFEPYWEDSERTIPEQGPRFLQPVEITRNREYAGLPAEVDEGLLECARQVRETPALTQLAWHCARLLYVHRDYPPAQIHCWPTLEAIFGDQAGLFYLIVALEAVPRMRAYHIAHGVPDDVTRATSTHFTESTRIYQQHHDGHWGVLPRVLYWLRNHTGGELYCLGRFEYMVRPFWGRVKAFQNDETGEVLALSCDGIHYDAQGFAVSSEEPASWKAHLIEEPETVRGFPIAPTGTAVKAEVTLPRSSWRCMLQPGDPILETHIPAGGKMTPERCRESMQRALYFFPRFFPERPFVAFGCASWILNPELETICGPSWNMVQWQRELYLFPVYSSPKDGLYFVFGRDDVDVATAPRDTSLRRALLEHLEAGRPLRSGGMFMLREDFRHYGSQHYRSMWPPSVLK